MDAAIVLSPVGRFELPLKFPADPAEFAVYVAIQLWMREHGTPPTTLELFVYTGLCERTFTNAVQRLLRKERLRRLAPV